MDYVLMTDSDSDLPLSLQEQYRIPFVAMPYVLDGEEYYADLGKNQDFKAFFDRMRAGSVPSTSQLPKEAYLEYFEPILKEKDLLFIAFSSNMSSTINNILAAREELLAKYPGRKFIVVDTLSISFPQTLLIEEAFKQYNAGKSMEEIAAWIESNKMRARAFFTVDDLVYLKQGGRISGASAVFGTMLSIKPILVESRNGRIVPAGKVQGRKKALRTLAEGCAANIENPEEQDIIVADADAEEDLQILKKMLLELIPNVRSIREYKVGPVVGAHCGPGTIAVCFMGKERDI